MTHQTFAAHQTVLNAKDTRTYPLQPHSIVRDVEYTHKSVITSNKCPLESQSATRVKGRKDGCSLGAKRKGFEKEAPSLPSHKGRVNVNMWVLGVCGCGCGCLGWELGNV